MSFIYGIHAHTHRHWAAHTYILCRCLCIVQLLALESICYNENQNCIVCMSDECNAVVCCVYYCVFGYVRVRVSYHARRLLWKIWLNIHILHGPSHTYIHRMNVMCVPKTSNCVTFEQIKTYITNVIHIFECSQRMAFIVAYILLDLKRIWCVHVVVEFNHECETYCI